MKKYLNYLPWLIAIVAIILLVINLMRTPQTNSFIDKDGDTFPAKNEKGQDVDCDDNNAEINPDAVEIPDDGINQDCRDGDLHLQTDPTQVKETKEVVLYKNFIFSDSVNQQTIINNSRLIKVKGGISNAQLSVKADTTEFGYDPMRKHTVYFYIDSGLQGGHLGTMKEKSPIVSVDFFTTQNPDGLEKVYQLKELPLSRLTNGAQPILDVVKILNGSEKHYIGGFVSTGIYGRLKEMTITYQCEDKKEDCEITLLK